MSARDFIALDTLGKLYHHGHGIGGYCLVCQRIVDVSLSALIKERGGDCRYIGMKPFTCELVGGVERAEFGLEVR